MPRTNDIQKAFPTFEDCEKAVKEGRANALERFIYNNEPAGFAEELIFRYALAEVLVEDRQKQAASGVVAEARKLGLDD